MARQRKISDERIADALRKAGGIKADAARTLKISRQAIQERVERSALLQNTITAAGEEMLDISESNLLKAIKAGDKEMTRFHLVQRGKKRGYGNSVSVGVDDAQAEAIVAGLGGNADAFRAALARLGVAQSEIP